jgi:hypothetical protein
VAGLTWGRRRGDRQRGGGLIQTRSARRELLRAHLDRVEGVGEQRAHEAGGLEETVGALVQKTRQALEGGRRKAAVDAESAGFCGMLRLEGERGGGGETGLGGVCKAVVVLPRHGAALRRM